MLTSIAAPELLNGMLSGLFGLGALFCFSGLILILQPQLFKEEANIYTQTTRLAQKGLTDEIAGLVGNAAQMLTAIDELTKTRRGSGLLLTLLGFAMMLAAILLIQRPG